MQFIIPHQNDCFFLSDSDKFLGWEYNSLFIGSADSHTDDCFI